MLHSNSHLPNWIGRNGTHRTPDTGGDGRSRPAGRSPAARPASQLMENAGAAVAEAARDMAEEGEVLVLRRAGQQWRRRLRGGRAAPRRTGRSVRVGAPRRARRAEGRRGRARPPPMTGRSRRLGAGTDLCADARRRRPVRRRPRRARSRAMRRAVVERVNASGRPVLAVDLPSGIDGRHRRGAGRRRSVRVRTVTFFRLKPGHLLLPGRLHCGATEVAQIGIPDCVLDDDPAADLPQRAGALARAPLRRPQPDDHKYSRGHAYRRLRSGCGDRRRAACGRRGAAGRRRRGDGRLAAGRGRRQRRASDRDHGAGVRGRRRASATLLGDPRAKAVVVGPGNGVGAPTRANVEAALASAAALVLDADALTSFKDDREALFAGIGRRVARRS